MLDTDLIPGGAKLIGNDSGECGADVLAHLGTRNIDEYVASRIQLEPDRRRKRLGTARRCDFLHGLLATAARENRTHAHDETGADRARQETASRNAIHVCFQGTHDHAPPFAAADLIALRIRV